MTWTCRLWSGENDLRLMIDLLRSSRPVERAADFPSAADLQELLALGRVRENTRLWLDAQGRLAGFCLVDHYQNLRFEIDPRATGREMEAEMVAWGAACVRRMMREQREALTLDASCREDDVERIALLERHGFVRQAVRSLHLARSLERPIPTPQLPAGFRIRHATGEQDVEALVALHRAAFGTEHMTVEERLAMMSAPDYEPELDLVAVAPDGRLAAYCLCSISREENAHSGRNEGTTDPVATHPDFQRRGLALALLLTGMKKLSERGMETALLGTSSENEGMLRTAQAAGFAVQATTVWFARQVAQDAGG